MDWVWRGDFYPATRPEYYSIKTQIEYESFSLKKKGVGMNKGVVMNQDPAKRTNDAGYTVPFAQLPLDKQEQLLKHRFKSYCSSVYKKTKVTEEQQRSATVCMRENPFYVNTVRAFRDRRYDYKGLTKVWKKKVSEAAVAKDLLAKIDAQNKCLVYDSLQLAHKCILNSFYGYVMRNGGNRILLTLGLLLKEEVVLQIKSRPKERSAIARRTCAEYRQVLRMATVAAIAVVRSWKSSNLRRRDLGTYRASAPLAATSACCKQIIFDYEFTHGFYTDTAAK
ncbi:unnamed protein product [Peronospora belbahrii]|uniref:DNA polymerase epsilon catalytic subunit n=1 Tax=Peronospora belbahrii TaxID=622444 RepID=A0ABN8CN80_9STRA|nr:unnamed protein product [Peronospora belbahrii]